VHARCLSIYIPFVPYTLVPVVLIVFYITITGIRLISRSPRVVATTLCEYPSLRGVNPSLIILITTFNIRDIRFCVYHINTHWAIFEIEFFMFRVICDLGILGTHKSNVQYLKGDGKNSSKLQPHSLSLSLSDSVKSNRDHFEFDRVLFLFF
jgi:hypothetical protein